MIVGMKQHTTNLKFPGPPSLPVIGSAPWVLHREGVLQGFLALAERYRAEGLFQIGAPDGDRPLFVINAALAAEVFDERRFTKAIHGPVKRLRDLAKDGLFTAHTEEENWGRAHRIVSPGFTAESMERYFPSMCQVTEALITHWRRASGPVDVVSDMTRLTLDTISLCGFHKHFDSFTAPALHPFLQALGRVLQEAADELKRPPWLSFAFRRARARFAQDVALMSATVDELIAARLSLPREEWPRDFLSLMLSERDPKSGEALSEENVRHQVLTFLVAGHETTAGLLSFTLHQLATDEALQARVYDEVTSAFGDGPPTRAGVLRLSLVMRCLSESLRLWPTVPVLSLAAVEDTVLGGKWPVRAGQVVNVLVSALHREPGIWHEPARFDPERFAPEQARTRPPSSYKPFGNGKRSCTGRIFALLESGLVLARLVQAFRFSTEAPLRIAPTTSPKPAGLRLRLVPRFDPGRA